MYNLDMQPLFTHQLRKSLLSLTVLPFLLVGCGANPKPETCQLVRAGDGDSVDLNCNGQTVKVRLYCIDAPELGQRPWGDQAKQYLESLLHRDLLLHPVEQDRYGRIVGELISTQDDAQNFNLSMVMAGQAAVYRRYCDRPEYLDSEQQARSYKVGIWSKPGQHQRPWQWRRHNPRR